MESDSRLGIDWLTLEQLSARTGLTVSGLADRLKRRDVAPVSYVHGTGAHVYSAGDCARAGLVIAKKPFDPEKEMRASEAADQYGFAGRSQLLLGIRHRYARCAGASGPAPTEELVAPGVCRKLGNGWLLDRSRVAELLAPQYDPKHEATAAELLQDFDQFSNAANLQRALRGSVPYRPVVAASGHEALVYPRAAVAEFFDGRNRKPRTRRAQASHPVRVQATRVSRSAVGPVLLRVPARTVAIPDEAAAWLLQISERDLRQATKLEHAATVPGLTGVAVSWVEARLVAREDYEGLVALALLLDGLLSADKTVDRTTAVLAATEKAA